MLRPITMLSGTVSALAAVALLSAGQAGADSELVMPDLEGMRLDKATAAVTSLSTDVQLQLNATNIRGTQDPLVLSNWKVCSQYPKADSPFEANDWLGVGVTRMGTDCW